MSHSLRPFHAYLMRIINYTTAKIPFFYKNYSFQTKICNYFAFKMHFHKKTQPTHPSVNKNMRFIVSLPRP